GHLLDVVGPEHVGMGMDWDGGGGVAGGEDASDRPKITAWLQRRGLSEAQIANIRTRDVLRAMRKVQGYSACSYGNSRIRRGQPPRPRRWQTQQQKRRASSPPFLWSTTAVDYCFPSTALRRL